MKSYKIASIISIIINVIALTGALVPSGVLLNGFFTVYEVHCYSKFHLSLGWFGVVSGISSAVCLALSAVVLAYDEKTYYQPLKVVPHI